MKWYRGKYKYAKNFVSFQIKVELHHVFVWKKSWRFVNNDLKKSQTRRWGGRKRKRRRERGRKEEEEEEILRIKLRSERYIAMVVHSGDMNLGIISI